DGPCGVKTKTGNAVCFMNTCLMASSWDKEICYEIGSMIGDEALRCEVDLMLIPAINIKRNPLAGRNFEYYSEDPYLTGTLASEYVNGLKSQGAITCVKHFDCNNQESMLWTQNSIVDDDTLRNIYLKAFEIVIKNTEVDSVMTAYNLVNGVYACEHKYLLTDILRGEWGFDGVVMSDWCAAANLVESVKNGMDLEMPGNAANSLPKLKKAYETGELTEERIDEAVLRLLNLQAKRPQKKAGAPISVDLDKLVKMTAESFVLLKNDGALPLKKEEKILLVGTAKAPRIQGGGCAKLKTNFVTLPYDEIKKYAGVCDNIDGYAVTESGVNFKAYDKIVVFLTLPDDCDSEAFDRTGMRYPKEQLAAIETIKKYNENIVVVLQNGSAVELPFEKDVKGILETYYAGSYGAVALAKALYGEISPSGRLAESFPVSYDDVPCKDQFGYKTDVVYKEKEFVGYRYYATYGVTPRYPFGFGLSYNGFDWSNICVTRVGEYAFEIELDVENLSKTLAGKETVQIYLESESKFEPKRELIAFQTVRLEKGEKKRVKITLDKSAFERYRGGNKTTVDGNYAICVSRNSEATIESQTFAFQREEPLQFNEQTLVGKLLSDPRYRKKTLEYMQEVINLWAYDDIHTQKNFEDEVFLKSSVYNMPLRAFPYFAPELFNDGTMYELIEELKKIGG
ncbi:MAG: glycoside hydrolase family 3 protein, partial [Clostridia bacterium]|nr:glycoside hydrolase family 3 protein [Clostridia bacterium]